VSLEAARGAHGCRSREAHDHPRSRSTLPSSRPEAEVA
jgi:hypothetical protein